MKHHLATAPRAKAGAGLPIAPSRDGDKLLSERLAGELLGSPSHMFWRRYDAAGIPGFPPLIRIGRRRFRWRNDVLRWVSSPEAARPLPSRRR